MDAKEAARIAKEYLFAILGEEQRIFNVMVEEVEKSDDDKCWLITLGWSGYPFGFSPVEQRQYKTFKIDINDGKVISMKIREVV